VVLCDPTGPELAARLFVGGGQIDDVALEFDLGVRELDHRQQVRNRHALGVESAASPYEAVPDLAREGIDAPLLRIRRHRVEMREQNQRGSVLCAPGAFQATPDGRPLRSAVGTGRRDHFVLDPRTPELRRQLACQRSLVSGRIHGVGSDRFRKQLRRAFFEGGLLKEPVEGPDRGGFGRGENGQKESRQADEPDPGECATNLSRPLCT